MASLFFDAQTRCLAYMKWVFEIFCTVKKDYGANYVLCKATWHFVSTQLHMGTILTGNKLYEELFDC